MKKILFVLSLAVLLASCAGITNTAEATATQYIAQNQTINLSLTQLPQYNKYANLDYGVRFNVIDCRATNNIVGKYEFFDNICPQVRVTPDVYSFTGDNVKRYMRALGFPLNSDVATDYMMQVAIDEYSVSYLLDRGWWGVVKLSIELYDSQNQLVYKPDQITGTGNNRGKALDWTFASKAINQAFLGAMQDVDWDRIAYFLRRANNPALEGNKAVSGQGNTALEHTIIRWYIESTPRGADVTWRVVSSTPNVKNTNFNYVGSTPYESTESFDIKGLTYNNSGDVQIEVSCEKPGYVTQRKRFNLRQVIDQKEISTKFNLIKEE